MVEIGVRIVVDLRTSCMRHGLYIDDQLVRCTAYRLFRNNKKTLRPYSDQNHDVET